MNNNDNNQKKLEVPAETETDLETTPLYDEKKVEGDKDIPSIYKKVLPLIVSGFYPFIASVPKVVLNVMTDGLVKVSDFFQERQRKNWQEKETWLREKADAPQLVIDNIKSIHDFSPLMALPVYLLFLLISGASHFAGYISRTRTLVEYEDNEEMPLSLATPEATITALIKQTIPPQIGDTMLDKQGLTKAARAVLVGAIKQIVPEDVLINNYYRGKIDFRELMKQLARKGYDTDQQDFWNNVIDKIPPVQDIISMAVREAFNPTMIETFGYADEFPDEFAEAGQKHGYSRDWLLKYWIAHWRLPSPEMVFEMLHRDLITEEHVDIFLKAADYPRYWRDAMKGISYQPLTRVDVRRMYRIGVFDDIEGMTPDESVIKAYKDIGYNEYNAKLMLKFTKKFEGEEKKKLTESKIMKLFRLGMIDEPKVRSMLAELKLRPEYIDYAIDRVEYEVQEDILDALLNKLRKMYIIGRIGKADVLTELSKESSVPVDTTALFRIWDYEKEGIRRLPTRSDVFRWIKNNVVSREQGKKRLMELGYSEADTNRYIKEITGD
jgi:hypothetical protein